MHESRDEMKGQKHLLLIAYYFPPLGMSGVQRVTKFAKYLPDNGWDVTVLTAEPGAYFAFDKSLLSDLNRPGITVVRTASFDPTRWIKSGSVQLPSERNRRFAALVSQTVFQPDNKIGWYPFAVGKGRGLLDREKYDAILSSAPPYTGHLIAEKLSRKSGVPYVLDYRDDWVENPRHEYPTEWHREVSERMERKVLRTASHVVVINDPIRISILNRTRDLDLKPGVTVVPHGFDPEDFPEYEKNRPRNDQMVLLYTGVFYDAQRPDAFLEGFASFLNVCPEARGKVCARFLGLLPQDSDELIRRLGLDQVVQYGGYVSHAEVVMEIKTADVLWMTIGEAKGSEGISTGKLYEYFGSRKPILGLVPTGTARNALTEYGAAEIVHPSDVDGVALAIRRLYDEWNSGVQRQPNLECVRTFDRKRIAANLAGILNGVTAN